MDELKTPRDVPAAGEILLIDKPIDWTSFDVVHRVRKLLGVRKVGHAGTLDPKATGLLIVCTGKQTKNLHQFVGLEKEYVGIFELGVETPSFDLETEVVARRDASSVTLAAIERVSRSIIGKQRQQPPMYSAAKHGGKPLYKYARRGRTVDRAAKEIEVFAFDIRGFTPPLVDFRVVCSKGTYVRSLVHEMGIALGCGAVLKSLRRTRIGSFHVEQAMQLQDLERLIDKSVTRERHEYDTGIPAS